MSPRVLLDGWMGAKMKMSLNRALNAAWLCSVQPPPLLSFQPFTLVSHPHSSKPVLYSSPYSHMHSSAASCREIAPASSERVRGERSHSSPCSAFLPLLAPVTDYQAWHKPLCCLPTCHPRLSSACLPACLPTCHRALRASGWSAGSAGRNGPARLRPIPTLPWLMCSCCCCWWRS